MPRQRNPNRKKAFEIYKKNNGNITNKQIAELLSENEKIIAVWKTRDKWKTILQSEKNNIEKNKRGSQLQNQNAIKHGFFSKYIPQETLEIINCEELNQLDMLWKSIMLQYAAIIRSQSIMYVEDKNDKTAEVINNDKNNQRLIVQQSWEKQADFLNAQSRAMTTLQGLIKSYDDLLNKNRDLATEEQRARIEVLKSKISKNKVLDDDMNINIVISPINKST